MEYLPILQELFESDTIIFLAIGAAIALIVGIKLGNHKKCMTGIAVLMSLYFICELLSNKHTSYMAEILLLFLGTAAIGGCIGLMASFVFCQLKSRE